MNEKTVKYDALGYFKHHPTVVYPADKHDPLSIPSELGSRWIRLASLRPGDWLSVVSYSGNRVYDCYVVQNSAILQRIELAWPDGKKDVASYYNVSWVGDDVVFRGRGEKRRWLKWVPKCLRHYFIPYSKP